MVTLGAAVTDKGSNAEKTNTSLVRTDAVQRTIKDYKLFQKMWIDA